MLLPLIMKNKIGYTILAAAQAVIIIASVGVGAHFSKHPIQYRDKIIIEPPKEISVETSIDGNVDWMKVPYGTIHVIINEGKLNGIKTLSVSNQSEECPYTMSVARNKQ